MYTKQTKKIKIAKRKNQRERNKKTYKENKKAKRKIIKTRKILTGGANDHHKEEEDIANDVWNDEAETPPEDKKLDNTDLLIDIIGKSSLKDPITLIFLSGYTVDIFPPENSWENYTVLHLKLHILREIINPTRMAEVNVISNNPSDTQTVLFHLYRHSNKSHLKLVYVTDMNDLTLFNNIIYLVNQLFSFKAYWDKYYNSLGKPSWRGVPTYEVLIRDRKNIDINWPGFFDESVSGERVSTSLSTSLYEKVFSKKEERFSAYKFAMSIIIYDLIYSDEINETLNNDYELDRKLKIELVDNMIDVVEKFEPVLRKSTRKDHKEWDKYFNVHGGLFNSSDPESSFDILLNSEAVNSKKRKNWRRKRINVENHQLWVFAPLELGGNPVDFYKKCLTLYVLFDKMKPIFDKMKPIFDEVITNNSDVSAQKNLALHSPLPFILRTEKRRRVG